MRAGDLLDGRFRLEREAGAGGMGVVFRAEDLHTGDVVAIKVLRGDRAASARFQREARVLAQLKHAAIVRYVAHGIASGSMYLAMEWLEGEGLDVTLERGALGIADTLHLARRIADALSFAHARGIVHRDLKPSNVFLRGGSVRDVMLLDFGIARVQGASVAMTGDGAVLGTPGYMAPEQVRGDPRIDARADVFSLGCVLFECLTGRAVFVGQSSMALLTKILMEEPPRASELRAGLPAPIDDLVSRMLQKAPAARLADGAEARDAIAVLEGLATIVTADDAAVPGRRSAITRGEQHVVSVVIAGGRAPAAARHGTEALDDDGTPFGATPRTLDELASLAPDDRTSLQMAGYGRTEVDDARVGAGLDALARFGAHVDRLADGAIVATLHGAGAATDQAAQAARCALAMRQLVADSPIVLATGRAELRGRLPIGPVIERAAKLLRAVARDVEDVENGESVPIHLDEVTAGLLPSRFQIATGKNGPELTREEQAADVARTVLGRTTRFVGRDAEMGTLAGLYSQVESDSVPRAAIVTGVPGLGKSRLREQLVAQLRGRDPAPSLWMAAAEPLGARSPLGMLGRLLRNAIGVSESKLDERARIIERIGARVPSSDVSRVSTFVAELMGMPLDAEPALPHSATHLLAARREPPLMAEQMRRAFVDFVRAECAAQPVLLVLEDAHWGDLPTMKLVDAALRELSDSALLVIAFARPEIEDAFPLLWADRSVVRISLAALTPRAAERLARDVLGPLPSAALVQQLVAQAAGNPFFLEELLRAFVSGDKGTMPETLLAIVQKRLEALDEDARRLLRAASVFGGVFWRGATAALLGGAEAIDFDRHVAGLVDREVLVRHGESRIPGEIELAFRHALVRDAAYQMLPDADRTLAHRFAGEWLEGAGETNRALLAEHFERGEDRPRAAKNYALAAAQALHADDLDGCLRFAKHALDIADDESDVRGAIHLARAEAHHWRAEFDQALAESSEALHLLERGGDPWLAASAIAVAACATLGRADEAIELATELSREGADHRPAFLLAAAQCAAFLPAVPIADALLALLPEATADVGDALLAARIEMARAMRAQSDGDLVRVLDHVSRAAEHFDRASHVRGARAARANAAHVSSQLGRHEDAERTLRDALADAERAGVMTTVAWTTMQLGMVLGHLGRSSEALAMEARALDLARKQGNRRLEAEVLLAMAEISNASGVPDLALAHAEKALAAADAPELRAAILSMLATARVALGDAKSARAAALEALAIVDAKGGAEDVEIVVRLADAESLHALGEHAAALEAVSAAKATLLARAAAIADAAHRETFLRRVAVNARILHLDEEWSKQHA